MSVRTVRLSDLSEPVRDFLSGMTPGEPLLVVDARGATVYEVAPFRIPSSEEQAQAWNKLTALQAIVARSMQAQGITEADVDRVLQDD